jgi:hypothetical protein
MQKFRRSHLLLGHIAATGLALVVTAEPARAQVFTGAAAWSVAGSTGAVDDDSTAIVSFGNTGGVSIKLTAAAGSIAVLRYPVSFLPSLVYEVHSGFYSTLDRLRLTMTFRKPDDSSYASATLRRVRLSDGVVSSVASVNTVGFGPGAAAQLSERTVSCGDEVPCVSPSEYAYYIELVLWKPESTNDPQVVALRVYTSKY